MTDRQPRVCPVEHAGALDGRIRRLLQNPARILAPYIKEGMTVLDMGCGPGFFSIEMARLVGPSGVVIAADLQEGMLRLLGEKIMKTDFHARIRIVRSEPDAVGVKEKVDFILAFYIVHEVPDKKSLFSQLKKILGQDGELLVVEPRIFEVSRKDFALTIRMAEEAGFESYGGPRLFLSRTALLKHA